MAVDEKLSERFRSSLDGVVGITERRMMGATCFMANGNMVGGAHRDKDGTGYFMFRVGRENAARAAAIGRGQEAVMGGRTMRGFYFVEADGCPDKIYDAWRGLALSYALSLPPK